MDKCGHLFYNFSDIYEVTWWNVEKSRVTYENTASLFVGNLKLSITCPSSINLLLTAIKPVLSSAKC